MSGREAVLGRLRRQLKRGETDGGAAAVAARLSRHARGPIPARSALDRAGQVALFRAQAEAVHASFTEVSDPAEVPRAVAEFLSRENLPARAVMAPDPELRALPWDRAPLLELREGKAEDADEVSVTGAYAGIAETGTLVMLSDPKHPTTLNLMPETHVVVLRRSQITGTYEDVWDRIRTAHGEGWMPRTVNHISGPSRTGDIEQTLELGAHGPRRLHIVLVDDETADGNATDRTGDGGS